MKGYIKELGKLILACLTKTCLFDNNLKSDLPTELKKFEGPRYFDRAKVA
jgi:hypothetical protein